MIIKSNFSDLRLLLESFIHNDIDEIVENSAFNWLTQGVHRITLLNQKKHTLFLWYASPTHDLFRNYPSVFNGSGLTAPENKGLATPFMTRSCHSQIKVIKGSLISWTIEDAKKPYTGSEFELIDFNPRTQQPNKKMLFRMNHIVCVRQSEMISLGASDLHNIAIDKGSSCAWLQQLGKPDKDYSPIYFSNVPIKPTPLKKPSKAEVLSIIKGVLNDCE